MLELIEAKHGKPIIILAANLFEEAYQEAQLEATQQTVNIVLHKEDYLRYRLGMSPNTARYLAGRLVAAADEVEAGPNYWPDGDSPTQSQQQGDAAEVYDPQVIRRDFEHNGKSYEVITEVSNQDGTAFTFVWHFGGEVFNTYGNPSNVQLMGLFNIWQRGHDLGRAQAQTEMRKALGL